MPAPYRLTTLPEPSEKPKIGSGRTLSIEKDKILDRAEFYATKHSMAFDRESLRALLMAESGLNPNAVNEGSQACGLFQRLKCPWELTRLGYKNWVVHATLDEQLDNGMAYIKHRYGTIANAWSFWTTHHWY